MQFSLRMSTDFPPVQTDSPTTEVELDELNYAPLAQHIAKCIRHSPAVDGLVFSINGPWGAGKTTMLEYIKAYLKDPNEGDLLKILEFNPWWNTSGDGLILQFLNFLQDEIPGLRLQESVGRIMTSFVRSTIRRLAKGAVDSVPVPEKMKEAINESAGLNVPSEAKQDGPADIRRALSGQLRKQDQIVVIIDDVDRLMPSEIRQLFQLIRAICNLPNVVYLLAFDRKLVAASLDRELGVPGAKFLEKIVQVQFDLPPVSGHRVREMFLRRGSALSAATDPELFDASLWSGLYQNGIEPLLDTPRSVIRLFNALAITYPPVCGEVDLVDFIAVETLRIFAPEAHAIIRDNKEKFVSGSYSRELARQEQVKAFHEKWLREIDPPTMREGVRQIVLRIFPEFQRYFLSPMMFSSHRSTTSLQLRVSTSRGFDKSFMYTVNASDVPREVYNKIVRSEKDLDSLIAALRELATPHAERAFHFLEYLRDDIGHNRISAERSKLLFTALMSAVDDVLPAFVIRNGAEIGTERLFPWVIEELMAKIDKAELPQLLREGLWAGEYSSIIVAAHLARDVELAPSREDAGSEPGFLVEGEALSLVREFLTERLLKHEPQKLLELPEFLQILFAVKFFQPATVTQFIARIESDSMLFLLFAKRFVSRPSISTVFRVRFDTKLDSRSLAAFGISLERFAGLLKIASSTLQEQAHLEDISFLDGLLLRAQSVEENGD